MMPVKTVSKLRGEHGFLTPIIRAHVLRKMTPADLAKATGWSVNTCKALLGGRNGRHLERAFELIAVLGPAFLNDALHHIGMGGARYLDSADACPRKLRTSASKLVTEISASDEDGRIDHHEAARIIPLLEEVQTRIVGAGKTLRQRRAA